MKKLLMLCLLWLVPSLVPGQSTSFYTDRAVATAPLLEHITGLIPIQNGQVRVCAFSPVPPIPCTAADGAVFDLNGNPLTVPGGQFGQITTDVVGRFSFGCVSGQSYTIQVEAQSSNTPTLNYPITCSANSTLTNILGSNNNFTGNNTFLGLTDISNLLHKCLVDGQGTHTSIIATYNDATCNAVEVPANYSETVGSNWNLNRVGVSIIFDGTCTVSFGTNTISVPAGTHSVTVFGFEGDPSAGACKFSYTGGSTFWTVGTSVSTTVGFHLAGVFLDLSGAGNSSVGLDLVRNTGFVLDRVYVNGNNAGATTQKGIVLDGTNAFTGGTIINSSAQLVNIALQLTGSGSNAANANVVINFHDYGGLVGVNSKCVDILAGEQNWFIGGDCEGATTGLHVANGAQQNTFWWRDESVTNDAVFDAGSALNELHMSVATTNITDNGTRNNIYAANTFVLDQNGNLSLGIFGTTGGSLSLAGSTSGTVKLIAPATASGVATIPANTGTVAENNVDNAFSVLETLGGGAKLGSSASSTLTQVERATATGCTTAAAAGATCQTTISWSHNFADTGYTALCIGQSTNAGVPLNGGNGARLVGSIVFVTAAATAVAAQFGSIECIGVHP